MVFPPRERLVQQRGGQARGTRRQSGAPFARRLNRGAERRRRTRYAGD
jgi:hypothetical protein